jgi:putative ABC transport system permease protein
MTGFAALALAASVVALSAIQVEELLQGAIFAGGVGAGILVLWLAARGLMFGVRRWFPTRWPYLWRQGLANLYRPANQTVTVVLALGFGASLLTTLFLVQHNLLSEFRVGEGASGRPNLMFFDIQPDQRAGLAALLTESGYPGTPMVPIVSMRIKELHDIPVRVLAPVDTTPADTAAPPPSRRNTQRAPNTGGPSSWAVRREYRSTYRDTMTSSETLLGGQWWQGPAGAEPNAPALISLESDIARELDVKLGDEILWDVSGIDIRTRVASLREVDWGRFETNFFVVFQSGVLERAPQMLVTLVRADSADARGQLQRRVAEQFPNVTVIDLSQIQSALDGIIDKAALIVRFLAGFSLVTGAVVLVGAVSASRLQRIREAVLLKTLGATRAQVLRVLVSEYAALGLLSAVASVSIATAAGWALAKWVFEQPFSLPAAQLGGLTLLLVVLTLAVGLWNSAEILKRAPLAVLREE